jgi:flagellar biosynthesis protein FliP
MARSKRRRVATTAARLLLVFATFLSPLSAQAPSDATSGGAFDLMGLSPDALSAAAKPKSADGGDGAVASVADDLAQPLKVVLVLTVLALAPAILMTATSFTRILIVLSFVRRALSVPELPPNQVLIGLSLFLTCVVMHPVISEVHEKAATPYLENQITLRVAGERAAESLKKFLLDHVRPEDARLFLELTESETPETREQTPLIVLVPAFALSELRTAFQMGFLVYLPFLILDLVVSSILLSMGMFMLPPVVISTPFKILLFILTDGWELVVRSVVRSFEGGAGA